MNAAIDNLQSGGGTNIGAGIQSAIELVQQSIDDPSTNVVETVIIVITDGQFTYNPSSDIQTLKMMGTRVFTFAIGSGSSCVPALESLASETGTGNCNRVVEAQDLGLTFDEEFIATRTIDTVRTLYCEDAPIKARSTISHLLFPRLLHILGRSLSQSTTLW